MSSQGVSYNGQSALSSVFPQVFSAVNTYSLMIQINDASAIRELVRVNDNFIHQAEINDFFPKNCRNLFQFYINVEGNNHINGFYSFDDLLCELGTESEYEHSITKEKMEEMNEQVICQTELKEEIEKALSKMNKENPVLMKIIDDELEELEQREHILKMMTTQWEDEETLIENICINLRKCVYWLFFNENQMKQYKDDFLFIPRISNQTIELLDNIFNQSEQMVNITNKQINKYITDFEEVNEICLQYQEQNIEYGETIELLEAEVEYTQNEGEGNEDETDEESEIDDESVWETTSINENENPDKSDATSESSDSTETEDSEEPLKVDECKNCVEYSYVINQMRIKDEKIKNLEEIIEAQDKQIEEYEEKEEKGRDASYKELEEAYELLNQKRWKEKDEHNKTIVEYATRCNILIDELRILRKQKNLSTDNI
jgi:hypothetical protein